MISRVSFELYIFLKLSQVQHLETLLAVKEETVAQLQAELENEVPAFLLTPTTFRGFLPFPPL